MPLRIVYRWAYIFSKFNVYVVKIRISIHYYYEKSYISHFLFLSRTETGEVLLWTVKRQSIFLRPSKPDEGVEIPTEDEIRTHFEQFGTITDVFIKPGSNDIFVMFSNSLEAQQAITTKIHCLNGFDFKAAPTRKFPTRRK